MRHFSKSRLVLFASLVLGTSVGAQAATTILSADWPIPVPDPKKTGASDKAFMSQVLMPYLQKNGIEIKRSNVNIWDQKAIITNIAGRTAPTIYPANVLGGYRAAPTVAAFKQGLAADVTPYVQKLGLLNKLPKGIRAAYEGMAVDGKYYGLPDSYIPGLGVYYRKDLVKQLGLKEPKPGWTWDDFFALAKGLSQGGKLKGAVIQSYIPQIELEANGFNVLTKVPDPGSNYHWKYDYTSRAADWKPIMDRWHKAIFDDRIIYAGDKALPDSEVAGYFNRGEAGMAMNNYFFYQCDSSKPDTPCGLAKKLGKKLEDVVGYVEMPRGKLDTVSTSQPIMGLVAISPDATPEQTEAAVKLWYYLRFGEGFVKSKQVAWKADKNIGKVFDDPFYLNGVKTIPGVPGSYASTWGADFERNVNAAARVPAIPFETTYIPADENPGPTTTAIDDVMNRLAFSRANTDWTAELGKAENTMNAQVRGLRSSVNKADFTGGAQKYFAALDSFYAKNSPKWYKAVFKPWLDKSVTPALK